MTAKKCTKKRDTRADVVVLPIQPIAFLMFSLSSRSWHVKPGFHMIAAIAEKKKFSDRSDHMETTFQRSQSEIDLFLSQRSLSLRSLRSLESGFHMIAMIAAIAELFFSAIAAITVIAATISKPGLVFGPFYVEVGTPDR